MTNPPPVSFDNARLIRTEQLDALEAVLPFDRRDKFAELLTDEDVATLKHLAGEGMGEKTLKALASDLAYLEARCDLATGSLPLTGTGSAAVEIRCPPPPGSGKAAGGCLARYTGQS